MSWWRRPNSRLAHDWYGFPGDFFSFQCINLSCLPLGFIPFFRYFLQCDVRKAVPAAARQPAYGADPYGSAYGGYGGYGAGYGAGYDPAAYGGYYGGYDQAAYGAYGDAGYAGYGAAAADPYGAAAPYDPYGPAAAYPGADASGEELWLKCRWKMSDLFIVNEIWWISSTSDLKWKFWFRFFLVIFLLIGLWMNEIFFCWKFGFRWRVFFRSNEGFFELDFFSPLLL